MRSALSLSLVLLATMCGHAASASEYSTAQRLLLSAYSSPQLEQCSTESFGFTLDQPAVMADELRVSTALCALLEPSAEPASRSYESAVLGGLPSRGP